MLRRCLRHLSTNAAAACPKQRLTHLLNEGTFQQRDIRARLDACGRNPNQIETTLSAIFATADTDGNQVLSLSEAVEAIKQLKEKCPLARGALDHATAVRHFENADKNNDGVLSFDEFYEFVCKNVVERAYALHQDSLSKAKETLSDNAFIEKRVAELVPGNYESGVHNNRLLLFGGDSPAAGAVLMRTNDYLDLSGHPFISAARAEAMVHEGGSEETKPRLFKMDQIDRHRALELRLAKMLQAEDAALTMSGAHAVVGLLKTLRGPQGPTGTPIYADRLSWTNACLRYDLSLTPFAHNNMSQLHTLASDEPGVIVVDALYGNGAVSDLKTVADIAESTGSVLVVDETHAFGCATGGLGLVDELNLSHRVHFRTIGFSKALAARGGAIIGPSRALEAFRFNDSTMIFSTAPKSHEAVGWDATIDVVLEEEWRREKLRYNHATLKQGLLDLGLEDHVAHSDRQILTIVTGDANTTQSFRDACAARGVFGAVFCPPFAQEGKNFVRFSVHAALTEEDLNRFVECMRDLRYLLPKQ